MTIDQMLAKAIDLRTDIERYRCMDHDLFDLDSFEEQDGHLASILVAMSEVEEDILELRRFNKVDM